MNNIFHDIVSLFTLGSIYSTKASEAERITETNTNLYETQYDMRGKTVDIYESVWEFKLGTS